MGGKESLQWKYLLPPSCTLEETALGPPELRPPPAAASVLPSAQQGARYGAPGFLALLLPVTCVVSSSRKVAVVGFSSILWLPHYPTQLFSYTADGLTFNIFPKGMREGIELF